MKHQENFSVFCSSLAIFAIVLLNGCGASESSYTLYRNSVTDENMRLHIATFDALEGHDYNMSNCQIAAELFQRQDGVKTKFWCEKGGYKK